MRAADYIVDIGPGAGVHGGEVVAAGTAEEVMNTPGSITGDYLSGRKSIPVPHRRAARAAGTSSTIQGRARRTTCGAWTCPSPLGTFTCVTGVSGSGKSSLVNEILFKRLAADLNRAKHPAWKARGHRGGWSSWIKSSTLTSPPIGRTPRSNPATYTGLFNDIRDRVRLHLRTPRPGATARAASPSTSGAGAARPARATAC